MTDDRRVKQAHCSCCQSMTAARQVVWKQRYKKEIEWSNARAMWTCLACHFAEQACCKARKITA
jgi:hypothetical protein